jgi:diguanylate cyclase (GGDEF)-like protein
MLEWDDDTKLSDRDEISRPTAERDRAYLIVLQGANVGEMYKISRPEVVIGRGQQADFQVLDEGVSRRHAIIRTSGADMIVEDQGSRNGTFVNGAKINVHKLSDGDKIQVGSTTILKFTYHDHLDESFQRQMYESALRDGLTRAFNKKYFLDRLESEFRFARRHRVPLAVLLFDIDHFKKITDTHGHLCGDFVLSSLSRRVHDSIRNEDVFARYGGEEFAVICRAIGLPNALVFGERLRKSIEAHAFNFEGTIVPVTISLGVVALPESEAAEPLALLAAADEALYTAKRTGRNRVVAAGFGPSAADDTTNG